MSAQKIEISKITAAEVELLQSISILTFTETFSCQNSENDMQKYILENLNVNKLTAELNTNGSEFYFLRLDKQVIGYLKLNSGLAQTEHHNANSIEIERIYLNAEFHGKGLGKILLNQAISVCKEKKSDYLWLGVWEKNFKAISFYKKNGFEQFDTHIFKLGEDEQTDILMKFKLN